MRETLGFTRLMMVLGSLSPFFILVAIKGSSVVSDTILAIACIFLILIPNIFIYLRISSSKKHSDKVACEIKSVSDNKEHLLVYLFTVLVPLYQASLDSGRELVLITAVFSFVIFLFLHLNLHYMNFIFAIFGYKIYTLEVDSSRRKIALLSKKDTIDKSKIRHFYRISNTVYFDE